MTNTPDENPKTRYGMAKVPLHFIPPLPLLELGRVMEGGAAKYGLCNWRTDRVSASTYYSAALRHLMAWYDGQDVDPESGVDHRAHVMGCMAILMDAASVGKLNDDRPVCGTTAAYLAANTRAIATPPLAACVEDEAAAA